MEKFKAFKKNVPVMGGMLLDKTLQLVLLVKGWKNTACWGFPRGKIHENETDTQCAVREVRTSSRVPILYWVWPVQYSWRQPICHHASGRADADVLHMQPFSFRLTCTSLTQRTVADAPASSVSALCMLAV